MSSLDNYFGFVDIAPMAALPLDPVTMVPPIVDQKDDSCIRKDRFDRLLIRVEQTDA